MHQAKTATRRRKDNFAPLSCAIYLDDGLPNSALHLYPEQGYLFVLTLFARVFKQLSSRG